MLFKVNPPKKNPKYFDWTRSTYYRKSLRTATPLTDMRWVKVLIKQKRGGRWNKKREWSLCERPVVKLLGTSLRQKRETHARSLWNIHMFTLTSCDYWAVAVTGQRRWRAKTTTRDQPGNMCVTQTLPHTQPHRPSCSIQYWKALFWCSLWQCLLNIMCKK